MGKIIDVIVIIDTNAILNWSELQSTNELEGPFGSQGHPQHLCEEYFASNFYPIQIVADPHYTYIDGTINTIINAQDQDRIRWRTVNLNYDMYFAPEHTDCAVMLYDIIPKNERYALSELQGLIIPISRLLPIYPPQSLPVYAERVCSYIWTTDVINPGYEMIEVPYMIKFAITDYQGNPIGYYMTDPMITIGSNPNHIPK